MRWWLALHRYAPNEDDEEDEEDDDDDDDDEEDAGEAISSRAVPVPYRTVYRVDPPPCLSSAADRPFRALLLSSPRPLLA